VLLRTECFQALGSLPNFVRCRTILCQDLVGSDRVEWELVRVESEGMLPGPFKDSMFTGVKGLLNSGAWFEVGSPH